ncbi:MAG TPA: hypothetical protein VD816_02825 [Ohtaekwangia sp.]|nr:hypothetical protein [Ohtaekwangia sp.]
MKNLLLVLLILLPFAAFPQAKPVKIVFDITSKDSLTHQAVLRHVTGMAKFTPIPGLKLLCMAAPYPWWWMENPP